MRIKKVNPKELAEIVMARSVCAVQVGAVLVDKHGIFAYGWNSVGFDGFGIHAEAHCLRRANRKRFAGATLYVIARRRKSGGTVTAKPCAACQKLVRKVGRVVYRDRDGWKELTA